MYFDVKAKCGHVGMNNYIVKSFAVVADNGKEAAEKCRWFPRVKHHYKDAIISVVKISKDEFDKIIEEHRRDPFFTCASVQEQKMLCDLTSEIIRNEEVEIRRKEKRVKRHKLDLIYAKESSFMIRNYEYAL